MEQKYRIRGRGPDGKTPPGYRIPDITTEKGYVALLRHEAKFRVDISLSAEFARSIKEVSAVIVPGDSFRLPPVAEMVECTVLPEE